MKKKLVFLNLVRTSGDAHPINYLYLAAMVKDMVDIKLIDINFDDIMKELLDYSPDFICFSSTTQEYLNTIKFAKEIRKSFPDAIFIIGGIHVSTTNDKDNVFNYIIKGDGEYQLLAIVDDREPIQRDIVNLDELPEPDYTILNDGYFRKIRQRSLKGKHSEAMIITSRHCPYSCSFCASTNYGKYQTHSADYIFNIIKKLYDKGVDVFNIVDDLFVINKKMIKELIILTKDMNIYFKCHSRTDIFNDEIAILLKELGVYFITFGVESGSQKTLDILNKCCKVSDNYRAISLAKRYGFYVIANLIVGIPGEKIEDIQETYKLYKYMKKNMVDEISLYTLVPFPATIFWRDDYELDKANFDYSNFDNPQLLDKDVDLKQFRKLCKKMLGSTKRRIIKQAVIRIFIEPRNIKFESIKNFVKELWR